MNSNESIKSPRLSFLFLFCILVGLSIFLRLTSTYNDYYTLFGFHLQKHGLSSVLLVAAMFAIFIQVYFTIQAKAAKVGLLVAFAVMFLSAALIIPAMLKFNRRVNNGILVEKLGDIPPLMLAAYKGDLREIERLIQNGADVNARNDVNNTALHFAAGGSPASQIYYGSPSAVAYLIERGADVNAQNDTGTTPLMDAVVNDNLETTKILIAHGADVNKVSKYDETALSMAVLRAHSEFADPPSMVPFVRRYSDIAIELLRHGAEPNFKDFTGRTPLQTAEKFHEEGLVKELKDHGAKE